MSTALKYFWLLQILTIFLPEQLCAQKQANFWFSSDYYIDFNFNPPKYNSCRFPDNGASVYASISDWKGELLFVTDGEEVFDKNLAKMPNGTTGVDFDHSYYNRPILLIIPKPFSNHYYIVNPSYSQTGNKLVYSMVDMGLNNGLGDVIQKATPLPNSSHYGYVATGNCNIFWLLTKPNRFLESDKYNYVLRYKIDKDGLHPVPDSILIDEIDNIGSLKLSSNGNKMILNGFGNYNKTFLYDFDNFNGTLSNEKILFLGTPIDNFEFSPNGKLLYLSRDRDLYQYDISLDKIEDIEQSGRLIHKGTAELSIDWKNLMPDGRMLCQQSSELGTSKTAVIEYPNLAGVACSLKINEIPFVFVGFPQFVSTFLSPQFDENFDISAGDSIETCSDTQLFLGKEPSYDIEYKWWPEKYLSNTTTSNPKFIYDDTISVKTDLQYILEGEKGYCYNSDTITITVHPDLDASVFGSKSVCPRVEEVDYWTKKDDRFRFEWTVDGGELASGQSTDSIKVNWGPTNSDASVTLAPYNELNCPSPPVKFPVRINVELQTETPIGDELLCSNLATEIPYQITNTNGSVYTWESDYGNILNGQGTNKIKVDWPGDGKYHLWVKEQSTTIDTVCYGVSDSLIVNLFTDSTKLEIEYSGVKHEDPGSYELQWFVGDTARIIDDIQIFTATELNPDWILKDATNKTENYLSFPDTTMNYAPMTFKISSTNGCQELVESEIHTTILLEGVADSTSNSMSLHWTPYAGWDNIEQYEVWYSKDDEGQLIRVASFKPGQYQWTNSWGADAFNHHYRIRALHGSYPFESWSNQLTLSFDHPLEIPNIFTPNGDGINDSFDFPNLELFHENELQIYDRNGAEVYFKNDYDGTWTGGNLSSGVYYYLFTEKRNQKTYKGWVHLLR